MAGRETEKRRRLRRSRLFATALLPTMAIVLVVSGYLKGAHPPFALVQFFAEASLIGGFADWFAVVALFRRPLGLKLPHTAVVPRNKDAIGRELGLFIEQNFLTAETIAPWLAKQDIVGRILRWAARPANAGAALGELAELVAPVRRAAAGMGVPALAAAVSNALSRADVANLLASALQAVLACGADHPLLDRFLAAVAGWLDENRARVKARFGAHSPLTPRFVDALVVDHFIDGIIDLVREVAADPRHEVRAKLGAWLHGFVARLRTDAALRQQVADIRRELLAQVDIDVVLSDLWSVARRFASDLDQAQIAQLIASSSQGMLRETEVVADCNERLSAAVASGLSSARLRLSTLVEDVVRAWDARVITEKLELEVGRDLQFIRLNGMVVGGLAGLVLHPLLVYAGVE